MHVLLTGMTLSGKTNMAKVLAREYQRRGILVAVLDILNDPEWGADFQTRDPGEFLEVVKRSRQCALFIDESGESVGRYNDEMFWLATRARHYGHKSHFVTQRVQQLSRTVWEQCTDLFLFNSSEYTSKILADEWNQRALREAHELSQYECFHARKMAGVSRFFAPRVSPPKIPLDSSGEAHATSNPVHTDRSGHGPDRAGEPAESAIQTRGLDQ